MNKFMHAQKKKIEIDKWCEGLKKQNDPGQEYILEWIQKNGDWFRKSWQKALCKNCFFIEECGFELKEHCEKFKSNNIQPGVD